MKAFLVALLAAVLCAQQGKEAGRARGEEKQGDKQEGLAAFVAAAEVLAGCFLVSATARNIWCGGVLAPGWVLCDPEEMNSGFSHPQLSSSNHSQLKTRPEKC